MMKKMSLLIMSVFLIFSLCSCSSPDLSRTDGFYKISRSHVGDHQDLKLDWDTSQTIKSIFDDLSEQYHAFLCSTWNYDLFEDGTRRYEHVTSDGIPIEYDYYGHSMTVSKYYFDYTPVKDVNGIEIETLLSDDENTLDILVPESYRADEEQIVAIYQEYMYFNNVEVDNFYREEFEEELNDKPANSFQINVIYVPDNTQYSVYDPTIEYDNIQNCIVIVVNSKNLHSVQLNAALTQGWYIYSDDKDIESAVRAVFEENSLETAFHSTQEVSQLYEAYQHDKTSEIMGLSILCLIGVALIVVIVLIVRKKLSHKKS